MRLLVLVLSLSSLSWSQLTTVTVTGTVRDSTGNPYAGGSGRAVLVSGNNSGNQNWLVHTTNPVPNPVIIYSLDSSGSFSMSLTKTDAISPTSAQPKWQFQFCASDGLTCFTMTPMSITAATDISAQIQAQSAFLPLSTSGCGPGNCVTKNPSLTQTITQPAGTSLALVGAMIITGQLTSTLGTGTAPFSIVSTTVVPNLNVSQLLGSTWASPGAIGSTAPNTGTFTTGTVKNLNGTAIAFADQFSGADACAQITAAQTSLPTTGGIVDGRAFQGSLAACSGGFTIGSATKPVTLLLGAATFTVNDQVIVNGSNSHIIGIGGSGGSATNFLQGASFPANTAITQIGTNAIISDATIERLGVNCNSVANSIGGKNVEGQELSGFLYFVSQNCTKYGLWYEGTDAQNSYAEHLNLLPVNGVTTYGLYVHNVPSFRGVNDITATTNDLSTIAAAIVIDGSGGTFYGVHVEKATIGIDIGPTLQSGGFYVNVSGTSTVGTVIKIENTSGNRVTISNLFQNSATTTLNDVLNSITDTHSLVKFYDSNAAGQAPFYLVGQQIYSNLATGTAPGVWASTTLNTNFNADLLDGFHAGNASTGHAMCWKDATHMGYCSTTVDASGLCTCN